MGVGQCLAVSVCECAGVCLVCVWCVSGVCLVCVCPWGICALLCCVERRLVPMAQSAGSEKFSVQRFVAFAGMPASLQRSLQGIAAPDASLQQLGWRLKKSLKWHMYYIFEESCMINHHK